MIWKNSLEGIYHFDTENGRLLAKEYDEETGDPIKLYEFDTEDGKVIKEDPRDWPICKEKTRPYSVDLDLFSFIIMNPRTKRVLWEKFIPAFAAECHLMGNIALIEKRYLRRELRRLEVWDLFRKKRLWVEKTDFFGDFSPEWRSKGIYLPSNSGLFFVDAKSGERIKIRNRGPYHGDSLGTDKIAFLFKERRGDFAIVFDSEGKEINRIDPKIVVRDNYTLSACPRKIITAETQDRLYIFKPDGNYVGSCKERFTNSCVVADKKIFVQTSKTLKCYEEGEKIWEYKPCPYLIDACKEAVVIANSKNTFLLNPKNGNVITKLPKRGLYFFTGSTLVRYYAKGENTIIEAYRDFEGKFT